MSTHKQDLDLLMSGNEHHGEQAPNLYATAPHAGALPGFKQRADRYGHGGNLSSGHGNLPNSLGSGQMPGTNPLARKGMNRGRRTRR